ncbi:hypothetical protein [Piscinibacter koreensis]|uniref:Uncharacterized protein n=1 Tax=Piscinibacter koreensis TaxID=2742824 RepID=A0A7Y6NP64_9BURK|nr:hypothetical protein [Schlegelella koreensis]NUZ06744.1 hypothetical protein [Schlegelella koreensis]
MLVLLTFSVTAVAQVDWRSVVTSCEKEPSDAAIAACVRANAAKQREEERRASEANQPKALGFRVSVRDTSTSVADFTGVELGEKGASISVQREKGEDASMVKAAVFGRWGAYFGGRVQPFIGASWLRDGTDAGKSDIRDLTVGSVGPLWESSGPGHELFSLLSTLQLTHREDLHGKGDGHLLRTHFDLVWVPLASGSLLGGFSVVPHVAALWHKRTGGGAEDGNWSSGYAGVAVSKPFGIGQQRFKASLLARKLYDIDVPGKNTKRRDKYVDVSLDYYFFNPEDKGAALQPSLFITREVGTDFLSGVEKTNKTTAGFRLKFN